MLRLIALTVFLFTGCATAPVEYHVQPDGSIMRAQGSNIQLVRHIPEGSKVVYPKVSNLIGDFDNQGNFEFECTTVTDFFGTNQTECLGSN